LLTKPRVSQSLNDYFQEKKGAKMVGPTKKAAKKAETSAKEIRQEGYEESVVRKGLNLSRRWGYRRP
jgi:hypothetical protein